MGVISIEIDMDGVLPDNITAFEKEIRKRIKVAIKRALFSSIRGRSETPKGTVIKWLKEDRQRP